MLDVLLQLSILSQKINIFLYIILYTSCVFVVSVYYIFINVFALCL